MPRHETLSIIITSFSCVAIIEGIRQPKGMINHKLMRSDFNHVKQMVSKAKVITFDVCNTLVLRALSKKFGQPKPKKSMGVL